MTKKIKIAVISSLIVLFFVGIVIIISSRTSTSDGLSEVLVEGTRITRETVQLSLDNYDTNLSIVEPGSYVLDGNFSHSIIIDADGAVTLVLNSVTISSFSAAIINKTNNPLTLLLIQDSVNEIYGGSNKKYRAAIYSEGEINITGSSGGLIAGGKLSTSVPIYSAGNISLNSGTVIMTSKSPISLENISISAKYINFELDSLARSGQATSIINSDGDTMCNFTSSTDFEYLFLTTDDLDEKKYFLSIDGEIKSSGVAS